MKQLQRLALLLIISGTLNIAQALFFIWTIKDKPVITTLMPAKPREQLPPIADLRTSIELIDEFKALPIEQLLTKLLNNHLVENGLRQSDLALACLVSFHHFDLMRAVSGHTQTIQKCEISYNTSNPKQKISVYPGFTEEQFESILTFARRERWPFTAEGIFNIWRQEGNKSGDPTIEDAFYLTSEFLAMENLFHRSNAKIDRREIFQMIMQGDWQILKQFTEKQKHSQDQSIARRQQLLLDYIAKGSKTAAYILLKTDGPFAARKLGDPTVLAILNLLDENTKEAKVFLSHLLASPRSDSVKQLATLKIKKISQDVSGQESNQQKNILIHFTPPKIEEKKNISVCPPLAYPPPKLKTPPLEQPKKVRTYIVQEGDSLWKISRRYKTSVEAIMRQNNLKTDLLKPGTTLKIP